MALVVTGPKVPSTLQVKPFSLSAVWIFLTYLMSVFVGCTSTIVSSGMIYISFQ